MLHQEPVGHDLIPEYELWREREEAYSNIIEQLKKPIIKKILLLLDKANSQFGSGFRIYDRDIKHHFSTARENTKYLDSILPIIKVYM